MTTTAGSTSSWAARLLPLVIAVSILLLAWLGYRAVDAWRQSAMLLAERRATETADRLATILSRDMRGVQVAVLASAQGDQFMLDQPFDVRAMAASAFARYPYPESFFAWRGATAPEDVVILNRSGRRPGWMPGNPGPTSFPVLVESAPSVARLLLDRVGRDAARGRRFAVFETSVEGTRYQVVARLLYRDALREQLEGVFGFTVSLAWVRAHYFPEVARQVARINASGSLLPLAVLDASGAQVAGDRVLPPPVSRREFPLTFFDPQLSPIDPGEELTPELWVAAAGAGEDPTLGDAIRGGNRTLLLAATAAGVFVLGLVLTARALQARARLAELRSEFVSTVTHEIKTPIAAIRAAGDTMARGRLTTPDALRDYAQIVVEQSKRLTRLVDNLLAYARITDVTEAYAFAPIDPGTLLDEVIAGFRSVLEDAGFDLAIEVQPGTPPIRGDDTACLLLLDNLVDNAIRYSREEKWLRLRARHHDTAVEVEVEDHGIGIPPDELAHVTRRFVRGRQARVGGSGLGLAIAARIARDHGGTLRIDSTVGQGTTVTVTLPSAEAPS
jgi:signal transduction histidine kinase